MPMSPRLLRPRQTGFNPRSISGLALWLDAADSSTLYTTDAGPVTAVSAPTEISGCVGWWDASDASSITQSGGLVSQWNDKSGLGNHATASGTARPTLTASGLNGLSVMTFDGTANSMAVAANAAFNTNELTYFIVFRATSDANKGVYTKISPSAGTNGFAIATRATSPFVWLLSKNSSQPQVLAVSGVSPTTQARIYSVTSSSTASGFLDGLSAVSASSTADHSLNQTVRIGSREGSEFFGGYIAEIIHFNAALSPANRARCEAYLAAKWGISGVHTAATATNDPVGAWLDKSGNGRHMLQPSSSPRPVRSTQNNRSSLSFNGTSQWMRQERTNYRARSHFLVWRRTATPTSFSSPLGANGTVAASLGGAAYAAEAQSLTYYSVNGNHWWSTNNANFAATASRYQGASLDVAALNVFTTGARIAPDTTAANVSYVVNANATAGNKAFFAGIEPFADTRLYPCQLLEAIQYDGVLTEAQSRQVERYLASKWGITLAPQVSNADAQDWINRVYANGGTVSAATASAVNQFCVDIENAGIRDRFYRLNLFCGNSDASLAAVRTPLFRGPSLTGTQYGGTTDTNVNFVQGDYAETGASGGLLGNGSSKYLATGFVPSSVLTRGDTHLSVHVAVAPTSGTFIPAIGAFEGSGQTSLIISHNAGTLASPFGYEDFNSVNGYVSGSQNNPVGHLLGSSVSAADRRAYRNGTQSGSTGQASLTGAMTANQVFVFSRNLNGAANLFSNARLAGYSIGAGMTAAQVLSFSAAMLAFQSAIGRPTT